MCSIWSKIYGATILGMRPWCPVHHQWRDLHCKVKVGHSLHRGTCQWGTRVWCVAGGCCLSLPHWQCFKYCNECWYVHLWQSVYSVPSALHFYMQILLIIGHLRKLWDRKSRQPFLTRLSFIVVQQDEWTCPAQSPRRLWVLFCFLSVL